MNLPNFVTDNPAAFIAALRATTLAVLTLLAAFGFPVTAAQQTAILDLGAALTAVSLLFSVGTVKATVPKTPSPDATSASIQAPQPPPPPPSAITDPSDPGLPPD
jgi:hypothetical protein